MNENKHSTRQGLARDGAPDLSADVWPAKFARAAVRRGRPRVAKPKVSTTIRLSADVIDYFKLGGRGWQTRIDPSPSRVDQAARYGLSGHACLETAPGVAPKQLG